MTEKTKPHKPEYKPVDTTDSAHAFTMKAMTSKESIAILANIDRSMLTRDALLLSIANDYDLDFLKEYITDELQLTCAIDGLRSHQITQIEKQPALMTPESQSLLDRIKGRFKR